MLFTSIWCPVFLRTLTLLFKKNKQKISRSLIYKEDGPLKLEILNLKSIKRVTTDSYIFKVFELRRFWISISSIYKRGSGRGRAKEKTKMHFIWHKATVMSQVCSLFSYSAVPTSLCVVQCVHLFFMERNILKVCFCCGRPCFSLLRYFNVAEWCFYMEKKSLFSFYIVILFQINWSQLFSVCCCLWNPKDDANDSEYTHLRYKRLYTGKNNNNKGCV